MALGKAEYRFFQEMVRKKAAIVLDDGKESMVESRLTPLLFQWGIATPEDLMHRLRTQPHGELHERVVDVLATHETLFFRDGHPFEILRNRFLPELIEKRKTTKTLRIWSGACSTGQEPYSIVMLLRQHFPALQGWNVEILATDLSGYMVEKASAGYYTQAQVDRGIPPPLLARFFDKADDLWRAKPDLRKAVDFRTLNLAEPWDLKGKFDLVFLRYVLIYFDAVTRAGILHKVHKHLSEDGYLLTGTAEGSVAATGAFEPLLIGKTLFYKPSRKSAIP